MSKAFDWVNGDLLLLRLLQYGVDGKFLEQLKHYTEIMYHV